MYELKVKSDVMMNKIVLGRAGHVPSFSSRFVNG